ncbi:MAG: CBS domain-containing protein [Lysobacter sp.]|nr:CBS domain-containing protein [Lysobacter sp.]
MDIRSVMTANPACCHRDATLQQVARLMKQNDCGQIPVVDDGNKPVGVITDRDIAVRAVAEGSDIRNATVADCMSTPVATVRDNSSVDECYRLMEQNRIRRVVVVDQQGNVAGIVAQADIALSGRDAKTAEVVKQVSHPS